MEMAPTRWRYEVGAHGDGVPLMLWLQGGGWPGSAARASGRGQIHGRLGQIWPVTVQVCSKSFTPLLANILPSMLLLPFYGRSASILGHWELRGKGRCGAFVELTTSR
ncbi:hypothetical protein OsJ_02029 [Oryza sativa Japonica Group]|uniref:Uncharacterized protein n=1 Tax=Oryza sativa subsp. japonica TaxID=39947 RepID=A2ZTV2_ORYSJ|nr:hypothetical protein OsJ_02029 [Oryza sativa Japonica Group]